MSKTHLIRLIHPWHQFAVAVLFCIVWTLSFSPRFLLLLGFLILDFGWLDFTWTAGLYFWTGPLSHLLVILFLPASQVSHYCDLLFTFPHVCIWIHILNYMWHKKSKTQFINNTEDVFLAFLYTQKGILKYYFIWIIKIISRLGWLVIEH